MKRIYQGKTKDVYELDASTYRLQFKDDVTGRDGVFDPGANEVGLTMDGIGRKNLEMSVFFFEKLKAMQLPTHYLTADLSKNTMDVTPVKAFGDGLEVITRYRAVGSFYRRYGKYIEEGAPLDQLIEITLKDDQRQDPLINEQALIALKLLTKAQYDEIISLNRQIADVIRKELLDHDLELYDLKLEFGLNSQGKILLIDEISGGNMRVYRSVTSEYVEPMELVELITQ
ncbi:phosphoribosylaminoimidazolesuccinocarboxamide synthase [Facklamia hominis]|uniref:phosphoribosylaminoimidazolesuccinocarboxamide synthase n=1 Tax=Facklamia hominis TaxID=178214 RepID=UPI0038FD253A